MFCLCNMHRSASIIPLMYGKLTCLLGLSFSVMHLKNCPCNKFLRWRYESVKSQISYSLTIFSGYPLHFRVVFTWLSSSCLLLCVLGNVCALYIRVLAMLILYFMSWCELKTRYLSVCLGFLNTAILSSLYIIISL